MIEVEHIDVWGFQHAIRGMRNAYNSWAKSDSIKCYENENCQGICKNNSCGWCIGPNDMGLMQDLYKGGSEHRKYLRQIFVSMDITAPLYWWKEFDTYKVGTTANSCSTMHMMHRLEFELDDFSHDHFDSGNLLWLQGIIDQLNANRERYLETKDKQQWWNMIQLLPSSYNQRRTVTMNYENVVSMIHQRKGHKLDEWREFIDILKDLPYVKEIMEESKDDKIDTGN